MRKQGSMGFLWLLLAGGFLWNPVVGVRDLLPDVIGYLLLCVGISKLADLNDTLAEAQKAFRSMLWVGFAQVGAWLLVSAFLQKSETELNRYEEPVWVLLFAFVFLVLEWYFLLPAWKNFFKGLSELAEFHGGDALLRERRGRGWSQRMTNLTRGFVICKTVLTVLPEASVLTSFETEAENPMFLFDWFPYLSAFRALAVIIGLIVGAVWLIGYCRFMRAAMTDLPWLERLRDRYEREILPDVGLLLNRRVSGAFTFFRVGIVFCANLTVLYREMLPDWFAVLLFLCGGLLLGTLLENFKPCLLSGCALLAVGIGRTVLNDLYLRENFIPQDALHLPTAYEQYFPVRVLSWLEAALTFVFILCVIGVLSGVAKKHTAVNYGEDRGLSQRATERLHRELRRKMIPVAVLWGISSVCKILEVELQPIYGWFWMVQFTLSIAAGIFFSAYLSKLAEQIADRYPVGKRA